jgi:hypothetical protein
MLQLVLVNEQADRLSVFFCGQGSVAVAGEAVGIPDLLCRGGECGEGKQNYKKQDAGTLLANEAQCARSMG